jgi:NDP-sugar pyrophosphorylase family protein
VHDALLFDPAEQFVVVEGCVIPELDLDRLLDAHARSGAALTVVVQPGPEGRDGSAFRPAGIYVFSRRALTLVSPTGYQDIKELLIPRLHKEGEHVAVYVSEQACLQVTDAATYVSANERQIAAVAGGDSMPSDYRRQDAARIHASASVTPDARFIGPVIVGPNSRVGAGATIVGPTAIGAECSIGAGAVVCRSIIWDHGRVGDGAMLDRCILAAYAALAPNQQMSNQLCVARDASRIRDRALPAGDGGDNPRALVRPRAGASARPSVDLSVGTAT